jgi:hypothetical protein
MPRGYCRKQLWWGFALGVPHHCDTYSIGLTGIGRHGSNTVADTVIRKRLPDTAKSCGREIDLGPSGSSQYSSLEIKSRISQYG